MTNAAKVRKIIATPEEGHVKDVGSPTATTSRSPNTVRRITVAPVYRPPPPRTFHLPAIPRLAHAFFDYLFGVLVVASPWLFGFTDQHLAPGIAVVLGSAVILYSVLTDYELGVVRLIPFAGHRFFDLAIAVGLAGSPVHFAMRGKAGVTFVILGLLLCAVTLLTRRPRESSTTY